MIVCNTSPLISLAIIGKIDLIQNIYGDWRVPETVARESAVDGKPFSIYLKNILSSHSASIKNELLTRSFELYLDRGEAEVIVLSGELNARIIFIDDKKWRRFAESNGFKVIGTVGLLLKAKKLGMISEVKPELIKLRQAEIRISDALFKDALSLSGE